MTVVEIIAVACGLACVGLLIKRSIWTWPFGLVQVALYIYIFWQAKLYSDVILHFVYVGLQIWGWAAWVKGNKRANDDEMPIGVIGPIGIAVSLAIVATGTAGLAFAMSFTDAAMPVADAFTTAASLTAQVLLARKVLQNWLLWIAVDVVAIPVYILRELHLTAGLYGVFLILAITGYFTWRAKLSAPSPSASSFRRTEATNTSSTSPATTSTS